VKHNDDKKTLDLQEDAAPAAWTSVRPLPGNELPMPAQQRVGRGDGGDRAQGRAAHPVRPRGEPSAIIVGETRSPDPNLSPQEPVLFDQVRDRLPLPAVQPAGQRARHHLERRGVDHEAELISRAGRNLSAELWNTTGLSLTLV